jgi:hypothetical protein
MPINFFFKTTLFLFLISISICSSGQAVLVDDFESYPGYQVCPAYTTDIQVYPTHGTNSTKGLRAFMNTFDSHDSLVTGWLQPLPSATIFFDFRIMEASALYPFIPATLNAGDLFSLSFTTDGQQWTILRTWSAANFTPITAFTRETVQLPACDSARIKFTVSRTNNPVDYFVDIDNLDVSNNPTGIEESPKNELARVYPSTFTDQFMIHTESNRSCDFVLTDLQGNMVCEGVTTGNLTSVRTGVLSQGIYLLRLSDALHSDVFRLIKQR